MHLALAAAFGLVVGLALGLTGGGGAIFAVPLLVYGLGVPPREAVGISLAAVGATALLGAVDRLRTRQVEVGIGLTFAVTGMLGAPLGAWVGGHLPEWLLLTCFAALMVLVAARTWQGAERLRAGSTAPPMEGPRRPTERWREALLLGATGLATGVLAGLFGVGGGFLIVPGLVLVAGLPMHRAAATSLLVIALISGAGLAAHLWADRPVQLGLTVAFVVGGAGGLLLGSRLARRLSGPRLQRLFAGVMIGVAAFVLVNTFALRKGGSP